MIPQKVRDKFQKLIKDAEEGKLVLVETKRADGTEVYVIVSVLDDHPDRIDVYPCAEMITGNPHKLYQTPENAVNLYKGNPVQ